MNASPNSIKPVHDLSHVHGGQVVNQVLALFDQGNLQNGDTVLLPTHYRIRMGQQTRAELYQEALTIQSYTIGMNQSPV